MNNNEDPIGLQMQRVGKELCMYEFFLDTTKDFINSKMTNRKKIKGIEALIKVTDRQFKFMNENKE